MGSHSFMRSLAVAAICHLVTAVPQAPLEQPQDATFISGAAPAEAAPTGGSGGCGGCELVADVAGLVWYSQIFLNAATQLVGVNNGSRQTRTSLLQNEGAFTFNPDATANGGAGLTQVNFENSVTVGGAVLTSPTAYNVFTGFTITSTFKNDEGSCTTSTIVSSLPTAYSEILSSANGRVFLDANGQRDFINHLGFTTCSGGGENFSPTALIQVKKTTTTQTTSFSGLLAQQSLSIPSPSSTPVVSNATFPSAGAPELVYGNSTITPPTNPINLPLYKTSVASASGGSGIPQPTNKVVPFVSGSSSQLPSGWLVAWIVGFVGFGAGVYLM